MDNDLLIHPSTRVLLDAYLTKPPQVLLLTGSVGIGKGTIAKAWASKIVSDHGNIHFLTTNDSISIDDIRDLYRSTRNKQSGRQVIIIDDSQTMSLEAQNAFLKLLEEPRPGLHFVLLATSINQLLSTVTSRAQILNILPVNPGMLSDFIRNKSPQTTDTELKQLLFIASGRPALVAKIIDDPNFRGEKFNVMAKAKQILTGNTYQRYIIINELNADRKYVQEVIEALSVMVYWQMKTSPAEKLSLWIERLNKLEDILTKISNNGNLRCQLLNAFASFE